MGTFVNIVGNRFGRLVVLGLAKKTPGSRIKWHCKCDCGNEKVVASFHLMGGDVRSCGCLRKETIAKISRTHGMTDHPLYIVWSSMLQRCYDAACKSYPRYGGRGIAVSGAWRESFQAFYDHVSGLEHCGEKGYSLDRIDNDSGYCPGNVKFSTRKEQSYNRRSNRWIECFGRTQSLSQWATEFGLGVPVLHRRLAKGWPIERAISEPARSPR